MQDQEIVVIGGVDAHADTHEAAALDERGALLGTEQFPTTTAGYSALLSWLESFGRIDTVATESTGSYAAGLTRYLREHAVAVVEVNQPHAHTRRRRGKSDSVDAEMAARSWLAGKATTVPKQTDGIVEAIRLLRVTRASAVKARSATMVQLSGLIVTAPQELREQLSKPKTIAGKATLCRRLRPGLGELDRPAQAAKLALRSLARRIETLDAEIADLDLQLQPLVRRAAPRTTQLLGISTGHAGQLLVTAGQNIDRLRGDAAFAAMCGASPIPASSGRTTRHRLNYGGDRQANRALHMIAVCRLRYCDRTRAYAKRRTAEGKTKREIIRCLKRYIARETYHALQADLADLDSRRRPTPAIAISCGAGPIGRNR
ncbi:MAG: IS110 family transposase [Actinomycetota bacterium]|nr:IS110 family transposase [Actinomycetota bacterium]